MDAREATANNADLWAAYLRRQWSAILDPFGLTDSANADALTRMFADVAAAGVATWLGIMLGQPVAQIYAGNAAGVTQFIEETTRKRERVRIPPEYARVREWTAPDMTQREEWASVAHQRAEALAV